MVDYDRVLDFLEAHGMEPERVDPKLVAQVCVGEGVDASSERGAPEAGESCREHTRLGGVLIDDVLLQHVGEEVEVPELGGRGG